MRILVLGINYAPELISTAVYTTGLAEHLSEGGDRVEVITALPYYPAWRVFEGWRGFRWRRKRPAARLGVTHCPLYVPARPSGAKRLVHHASFALTALPVALWRALTFRPDLIFVVAPSLVSAPVGWLAAKLCGAKTWLHVQDFEVEAAFATGLLPEAGRVGALARRFEAAVLGRFDRISSISVPMVAKLREKGIAPERTYEFRNWADLGRVTPRETPSPLRAELGIETAHVALYSGNLANKQGLEILPEMARRLAHRRDLTFVVCGDGPMRETLVASAQGLSNIRFFPLQPVEKLGALMTMADVHLLPQIAGAADLVLPSKLTNMLASGRPVLATAEPQTALGAEVSGAGLLVAPGDFIAASQALETLLDDPELRRRLGIKARERALEHWDRTAILGRLKNEFRALARQT
ncbi:WcaI family glycosyltransferase [Rhodobacter lacus]|uniref:WcaI family glycosyltransferase n=1 Tax=Rhodobacter lacus TaxID=1641972 RepID=A0ABW5AAH7_9RHOB